MRARGACVLKTSDINHSPRKMCATQCWWYDVARQSTDTMTQGAETPGPGAAPCRGYEVRDGTLAFVTATDSNIKYMCAYTIMKERASVCLCACGCVCARLPRAHTPTPFRACRLLSQPRQVAHTEIQFILNNCCLPFFVKDK